MPCNPTAPITCLGLGASDALNTVADVAVATTGSAFADSVRDGAAWVMKTTVGWWIEVPSIDLAGSPAVRLRDYVLWLALAVAAGSVIFQGAKSALTRRGEPLLDAGRGILTLGLWAAIGISVPALALQIGDEFSVWILDKAASGQIADRLVKLASLTGVESAGAVLVLGYIAMLAGIVQAVLMIFREGAVVVLAGSIVLAAAGNATGFGRPWLMKLLGWMLALIAFKPVAALVYATALVMVGDGDDPRTVMVGLTMMALAIAALPALMKLFSWATGSVGHQGSFAGAAAAGMGMAAAGVQAASSLRSRSGAKSSASSRSGDQAENISRDLGPATSSFDGGGGVKSSGSGSPAGAKAGGFAVPTNAAVAAVYATKTAVDLAKSAGDSVSSVMTDSSGGSGAGSGVGSGNSGAGPQGAGRGKGERSA